MASMLLAPPPTRPRHAAAEVPTGRHRLPEPGGWVDPVAAQIRRDLLFHLRSLRDEARELRRQPSFRARRVRLMREVRRRDRLRRIAQVTAWCTLLLGRMSKRWAAVTAASLHHVPAPARWVVWLHRAQPARQCRWIAQRARRRAPAILAVLLVVVSVLALLAG
jgi:hypothetical protein